jgi:hypothetical protein
MFFVCNSSCASICSVQQKSISSYNLREFFTRELVELKGFTFYFVVVVVVVLLLVVRIDVSQIKAF